MAAVAVTPRCFLFIHQNFPGQYRHLATALLARGDRLVAIGGPSAQPLKGVELHQYDPMPAAGVPACHPWAADLQTKAIRAEAVGKLLAGLLQAEFSPDLVIGHSGWGELLAIKDLLPQVPVLHQVEWIYQLQGGDTNFDPEFSSLDWQAQSCLRLRRAPQLMALQDLDWGLSPTKWQASTVPVEYRNRLSIIHEGIDTTTICPKSGSGLSLQKAGLQFEAGAELVTFVARNLEPYRGFHVFMRMLPALQQLRPKAHVVIVGGENVSYGQPAPNGMSWKQTLLQELNGQLDLSRIHFVGKIPHPLLHELFRICACHAYLSYPFVLSWSMLEAMSCGAVVVGSATPPVEEVIEHGRNGLLVNFFDQQAWAHTIAAVLENPTAHKHLGVAARQTIIERYDLHSSCLPQQLKLIDKLIIQGCSSDQGVSLEQGSAANAAI